ncbi:hypothetical protein QBC47DRAFT_351783 [Echria macrotheca]|uniref:CorA-like transporter domain-containing protein n=1 Tax=Echria macrotheca TaxID=438768 RepID=A0AAJ0F7B1_9PEZI|nr:hypothetical protein QBC47DRAFT_351783 [Echria macrotheca]
MSSRNANSPPSMSSITIPRPFLKSCQQYDVYPVKLVERLGTKYGVPLLQLYQERFKERQRDLNLFVDESRFFVPYWDVSESGAVDQRNLKSEQEFGDWLGDDFRLDPADTGKGPALVRSVKRDPRCRFVFLPTASSVDPLEITPAALKRLLAYFQVFPSVLDFLYTFGPKNGGERESTHFSGFRTEKTFRNIQPALEIPALGRSGKRYQLCCTLKSVALKSVDEKAMINKTWRVRSAVIYHQFDIEKGTQLWILGDPLLGIHKLVQEHIHEQKNHSARFGTFEQAFNSSLQMMLHYAQWATEEWRWHIQSYEEIVDKITQYYVLIPDDVTWERDGLLYIQEREQYLTDSITCVESNIAVMKRLGTFYTDLVEDPSWPKSEVLAAKTNVKEFVAQLDEYMYDLEMQLKRANQALRLAKDRKDILIQHLNAQNAAKQESYTQIMWQQQHKTVLDAVAMKVVTVVTLFFLPMTFVSTFFSTDVVKYQSDPGSASPTASLSGLDGNFSISALRMFFVISVPLMIITFLFAYALYWRESRRIIATEREYRRKLHV